MFTRGFRIGRLWGIELLVDWSLAIIFLLVLFNLALGVFPMWHPEWGPVLQWGMALVAAVVFFASVVVHELSHALVAKAYGLPVRQIVLFLFGGVANIEKEPQSPKVEFLMAAVGPLTSFVLGVGFVFLAVLSAGPVPADATAEEFLAALGPAATIFAWLGPINLLLAFFNMIPGFPLDGGRVFRAMVWWATGNLKTATNVASGVGQGFGLLLMISGVAMIFGVQLPGIGGGVLQGFWFAFIGWFLRQAAVASRQQFLVQESLDGIPVSRLMRREVVTVTPDLTVAELVDDYLMQTEQRAFPVIERNRLVGLVSLPDIRRLPRPDWPLTRVREIMTPEAELAEVAPAQPSIEALQQLAGRDVNQLPVVEEGRLLGLIRRSDIVRWLQLQEAEA